MKQSFPPKEKKNERNEEMNEKSLEEYRIAIYWIK